MLKTVLTYAALLASISIGAPDAMAFSKDSLTWKKCTSCHEVKQGKISRIEEIRTTPEEWTLIINRMARIHDMDLNEGEMDVLLKELCATQGLTPEEAQQVSYLDLFNNTQQMEWPKDGKEEKFFTTCVRCHSAGKVYSYRMTESAWGKMRDFHYYMFPGIMFQMREMKWDKEADEVLANLAKSHSYGRASKAVNENPAGSWMILGYEPGKGDYRGKATVKSVGNGDYGVVGTLEFADGTFENFAGDASLYGAHALRTSMIHNGLPTKGAYIFSDGIIQGAHHFPAPNFRTSTSTWYPITKNQQVLKVTPSYLLKDEVTTLTIEGLNLPNVNGTDLRFESGEVEVLSVKRIDSNVIKAEVVSHGKSVNQVSLKVKSLKAGVITLAPQIDFITVTPEMGRARLDGGERYLPEGVQFEAIAYSTGNDINDDADDVALGPVPARFTLAEEFTRPDDDDLPWVGDIERDGTYIPMGNYGAIPARETQSEAAGLVKVRAEYRHGNHLHTAEARLVVTVPDYVPGIK